MKRIAIILTALLLSACSVGYVNQEKINPGDTQLCGVIKQINNLVPVFVEEKDSATDVKVKIPVEVPIDLDVKRKVDRSLHFLTNKFNQQVTVLRTAMFTNIVLRNAAPCDLTNITRSWDNLDLIIEATKGVKNDTPDLIRELESSKASTSLGFEPDEPGLVERLRERNNEIETGETE